MSIKVNYEMLDNKCFVNYFNFLISSMYKILPIVEEEPETLKSYLESLQIELIGNQSLFEKIRYDANFISLLAILNYFINNECSHKTYKREVFKCINIIEGLKEKYK
jgi:hypothetical protein